jgi:CRISPR-associated protein Cas1
MSLLPGRLGLDGAELRHEDRVPFLALRMGRLEVQEGCLRFVSEAGEQVIPYQRVSCIVLEPGTSITHDALRLLARHGVGLVATGLDGVKCYTAPPLLSDSSDLARRQARAWADLELRLHIALKQFAMRFGESPPARDLDALRGLEGARIREAYRHHAQANGIRWDVPRSTERGRGDANTALNYAADAVYAAAAIAVYATATIPQLGFLHEDSGRAFVLDVADLHRTAVTIPAAFRALRRWLDSGEQDSLERSVRVAMMEQLRRRSLVAAMIEQIGELLG